ncbi:hypothetical protein GCM10018785_36430 [Streptomyces longispororuber]|uniref:Uncharacterized protein n=1 Tax=Streptomyces longispororuber TaxID=68230 RepID=A0A919DNT6_9ACTN|nr:hypothetical protein GCM10018785_36430 [Streptomyces longispororuber]
MDRGPGEGQAEECGAECFQDHGVFPPSWPGADRAAGAVRCGAVRCGALRGRADRVAGVDRVIRVWIVGAESWGKSVLAGLPPAFGTQPSTPIHVRFAPMVPVRRMNRE